MLLVTFSSTRPGQGSLASRMRGWKDDAAGLEQRLKDLETIARSLRRRWWLVGFGLALGIIGWGFGVVHARPGTMVLLAGGGLILNACWASSTSVGGIAGGSSTRWRCWMCCSWRCSWCGSGTAASSWRS